jgi:hypothetical protein
MAEKKTSNRNRNEECFKVNLLRDISTRWLYGHRVKKIVEDSDIGKQLKKNGTMYVQY